MPSSNLPCSPHLSIHGTSLHHMARALEQICHRTKGGNSAWVSCTMHARSSSMIKSFSFFCFNKLFQDHVENWCCQILAFNGFDDHASAQVYTKALRYLASELPTENNLLKDQTSTMQLGNHCCSCINHWQSQARLFSFQPTMWGSHHKRLDHQWCNHNLTLVLNWLL